jgi:hypothetical protein
MAQTLQQITENEPRATVLIDQHPDQLDELIANVRVDVLKREES